MNSIVEAKKINFCYRESNNILMDIDFSIYPGQLISLLGPNGVGKSTFLNCICGLLKPQSGTVQLCGHDIFKKSRKSIAQSIAYVPQKTTVSFDYSVKDFVVMGRTAHMSMLATPTREDFEKANAAMKELGIIDFADRSISELSGGEQQKACIARALVQSPKLIVLDEPTSALDFGNQLKVLKLIKHLSETGYAILLTTHNPDHCIMLEGTVAILDKKGNLEMGTCSDVMNEERLRRVYNTELRLVYVDEIKRKVCVPCGLEYESKMF